MDKTNPEGIQAGIFLQLLATELISDNPNKKNIRSLCEQLNIPYSSDSMLLMSSVLEMLNKYPNYKIKDLEIL